MKKILLLSTLMLFGSLSFANLHNVKNVKKIKVEKKEVAVVYWIVYFHCTDGHISGTFQTPSGDYGTW